MLRYTDWEGVITNSIPLGRLSPTKSQHDLSQYIASNLQHAYSFGQNGAERLMVGPGQVSTLLKHLWTSSVHDYRNESLRIQLALALIIFSAIAASVGGIAESGSYSQYTANFLPNQHNHPLLKDASTRELTASPSPESIYKHCEYHSLLNVHLLPDTHTVGPV